MANSRINPSWTGERRKARCFMERTGDWSFKNIPEVRENIGICGSPFRALCKRAMPEINFVPDEKILKKEKCDYHYQYRV